MDVLNEVVAAHRMFISLLTQAPLVPTAMKFSGLYKGYVFAQFDSQEDAHHVLRYYHQPQFNKYVASWAEDMMTVTVERGWIPWSVTLLSPLLLRA